MSKEYEPFDLEQALAGEPVVLRDGSKAFVRHLEEDLTVDAHHQLTGYHLTKRAGNKLTTWCLDGSYARQKEPCSRDIVGMYPQYRLIHGVKVPAFPDWRPKKGEEYYAVEILSPHFYRTLIWGGDWLDLLLQKRGLVYPATAAGNQAAILHAKAMLGLVAGEQQDASN